MHSRHLFQITKHVITTTSCDLLNFSDMVLAVISESSNRNSYKPQYQGRYKFIALPVLKDLSSSSKERT